jgi:ubiquinone/menaquinone biosynthesis C-methylase UbiE
MTTADANGPNAEQFKHWNENAGPTWVAQEDKIASQLRELGELSMQRAAFAPGERVLDVGCGFGSTSIEIARRVGASGSVLGVDISAPMLERARQIAREADIRNVSFEQADAQTAELPERAFDALYSRFGVMFFSDPEAAFSNLKRALRPGARLTFICWRALQENPWIHVPMTAVMPHIAVTLPEPGAPGPFAFADGGRVRGILERAGFSDVSLEPVDRPLSVGGPGASLDDVVTFATQMGPAGAALRSAPPEARPAAISAVREAFAPYFTAEGVKMAAASWLVTAAAK